MNVREQAVCCARKQIMIQPMRRSTYACLSSSPSLYLEHSNVHLLQVVFFHDILFATFGFGFSPSLEDEVIIAIGDLQHFKLLR